MAAAAELAARSLCQAVLFARRNEAMAAAQRVEVVLPAEVEVVEVEQDVDMERLGGATAIGPLLQDPAAPVHDRSRGCSIQDIIGVAVIAGLQATTRLGYELSGKEH